MKLLVPFFLSLSICAAVVTGANYASADDVPTITDPVRVAQTSPITGPVDEAPKQVLIAQADTGSTGSGSAHSDAGSASTPAAPSASSPSDKLHDPLSSPGASWDDLKAAKKVGWAAAVFAFLVLLCKLLGRLKGKLSWLGKGKVPVVVGAIAALAAACYNAAVDGGAWTATLMAGFVALAHYIDAGDKTQT